MESTIHSCEYVPGEQWKSLEIDPRYWVSSYGRVASKNGLITPGVCNGYQQLNIFVAPKVRKWFLLHRLIAQTFIGPCPVPGYQVAHFDGDRSNNNVDNLRWASAVENAADKVRHGTQPYGEQLHNHKLTNEDVLKIRELSASGLSHRKIQKQHFPFVCASTVQKVISRVYWNHI